MEKRGFVLLLFLLSTHIYSKICNYTTCGCSLRGGALKASLSAAISLLKLTVADSTVHAMKFRSPDPYEWT